MCLILFSYEDHPFYRLFLAANRDEFYDRATQPLGFWDDHNILAGRDLKCGGTWMGVSRKGQFAAITNFRQGISTKDIQPSRGLIVSDFLSSNDNAQQFLEKLAMEGHRYNGFNLIAGDRQSIFYYSNKKDGVQRIERGLYGLSNRFLDTPWAKVENGKRRLKAMFDMNTDIDEEAVFEILSDRSRPPDEQLPDTGVGITWERILSSIFIETEIYGTRSSSILMIEKSGKIIFIERTFKPGTNAYKTRKFCFMIK